MTDDHEARIEALEHRVRELEQQQKAPLPVESNSILQLIEEADAYASERQSLRQQIMETIENFESAYGDAAPIAFVLRSVRDEGYDDEAIMDAFDVLVRDGAIYKPDADTVRVA